MESIWNSGTIFNMACGYFAQNSFSSRDVTMQFVTRNGYSCEYPGYPWLLLINIFVDISIGPQWTHSGDATHSGVPASALISSNTLRRPQLLLSGWLQLGAASLAMALSCSGNLQIPSIDEGGREFKKRIWTPPPPLRLRAS